MGTVKEREQATKPDMQQMMKVFKELGTPGAQHKQLAMMEGNWKSKVKSWYEPGKPPVESTGRTVQKMILDGHFLQQNETGMMGGSPFTGLGIIGFDNSSKRFISTWMDTTSTNMLNFAGTASMDGKTITMETGFVNSVFGQTKWRSVTRITDKDSYTFELFSQDKSGKENKMMEINYTRE